MTELRTTALHDRHEALGASFTDFGGWLMPVRYTSDLAEHHAVRTTAGLFDISHMAEFEVTGPDAGAFLDYALAGAISPMRVGKAKYSLVLAESGGIVDDVIVYRLADERFLVIANAGNRDAVAAALTERLAGFDTEVGDSTDAFSLIAVQGPVARAVVEATSGIADVQPSFAELGYYAWSDGTFDGAPLFVARTGYTGEDGFEVMVPAEGAVTFWNRLLEQGVKPAGLGARDTLRLEAGMALYGQDMDESATPYEAGLAWTVALDEGREFTGRARLESQKATGAARQMIGLVLDEKGVLRHGQAVFTAAGEGEILSGTFSPTLGKAIALARVPAGDTGAVEVDIRGKRLPVRVVKYPFVRDGVAQPGVLA